MPREKFLLMVALFAVGLSLHNNVYAEATPANNPRLRVEALTILNDLDVTPEQLKALHRLSRDAAAAPAAEKLPEDYRAALLATIEAFEKNDQAAISTAEEKVDQVCIKLKIEDEPPIETTEISHERAREFLRQLTPSQLAGFFADRGDDIASPLETLTDAMEAIRGKKDADFEKLRDQTTKQVALLQGGFEGRANRNITEKITAWLTRVHDLSDSDFQARRDQLENEARRIVGPPDPIQTLRHWMLNSLAQLLSNPELPGAIETLQRGAANK